MTLKELEHFDGKNGAPAYVAVSGMIYDVSNSKHWQQGNHEGAHQAGQDLTAALKSAPHVRSVIERFPVVGQLTITSATQQLGKKFPWVPLFVGAVVIVALAVVILR